MKFNKLSLLCAVACAAFAGQASAQLSNVTAAATIVNDANANNRVLYVSGASAVQAGFNQVAAKLLTGTVYTFSPLSTSGRTNSDYRAVAGKLTAAAGGWAAGTNVIIINRARGGSVWGVNPVARATSIESLDVSVASCSAGSGTAFTCGLNNRVPDAGVSDVAPALFDGVFNTEGEPAESALDPSELASLTATPIYSLAFGLPMTRNVPLFKVNKTAASAMMTGNVGTWGAVDAAAALTQAQLDASNGSTDDILVCRRVNGSGSQAVANLYFGNYPCDTGTRSNPPADRDAGLAWNGVNGFVVEGNTEALNVVENSSSGDVRSCMNNAVLASTRVFNAAAVPGVLSADGKSVVGAVGYTHYLTADRAGKPVAVQFRDGRAHKAVGVLSMDSLNSSTTTSSWTFRSMDGAGEITWNGTIGTAPVTTGTGRHPTLENLVDGTWDKQGWISFNVPARTTGNKAVLSANFVTAAQDPAILQGLTALRYAAASMPGTSAPTPALQAQVLRAGYVNGDQCAPLNRNF